LADPEIGKRGRKSVRPLRVTFVISSLVAGGAERVASLLCNAWADQGWSISIITLMEAGNPPFYELYPEVRHVSLSLGTHDPEAETKGLIEGLIANLRRIRALRRTIRESRPDVVISFLDRTNIRCLCASVGLRFPVIVSERTDPGNRNIGWRWEVLRRATYPWAAAIVVQTERVLRRFPDRLHKRTHIIPNPVSVPPKPASEIPDAPNQRQRHTIAGLGSLRPVKGFDLLLEAFAMVAKAHPSWSLTIWGDGPDRLGLESRAAALGLAGRVCLPGVTRRPFDALRGADLFVLPSRAEGFPNALLEAMAVGLAAISFDCQSGPADIIRDGVDGLLVPPEDIRSLAAALDRLMGDPTERWRLGNRGREVLDRFSLQKIKSLWENLIGQVISIAH
jgi:GalNAc-alpha-(1->4)-GalNAc-alpha-(1->3)-diNAcBac-PP-undecaprenol alpha-1,4-N-acetyl-D-galactosaminyltransferase